MNTYQKVQNLIGDTKSYKLLISLLSKKDIYRIFAHLGLQILLSVLDLAGIFLIGLMASLSISGVGGTEPNKVASEILNFINIKNSTMQLQTLIIGIIASFVLILRTFLSLLITHSMLKFLGNKSRQISATLLNKLLSAGLQKIEKFSIPEIVFMLTTGVSKLVVGAIGQITQIISDLILLSILFCGLVFFDPLIALLTLALFMVVFMIMYFQLSGKARRLGEENYELGIESENLIHNTIFLFKEIFVRNTLKVYFNQIVLVQSKVIRNYIKLAFLPNVGKYVFELTLVVGGVFVGCLQLIIHDSVQAATSISIFIVAALRIAPAILRIQQNAIQLQESLGVSSLTRRMIEELNEVDMVDFEASDNVKELEVFTPVVVVKNLMFKYPNSDNVTLSDINLEVAQGNQVAIIGPSGAGKSTLLNLILGIINPVAGKILISGKSPREAFRTWPGAVSYVPQNVFLSAGSLESNLTIGLNSELIGNELMIEVLRRAELNLFPQDNRDDHEKLQFQIQYGGSNLSGGEKQRVAIARALLSRPQILILDEATSALDNETEANLTQTLAALKGKITVLIVAHRLSTVRNADLIVYLNNGQIQAVGKLDDIKKSVPDFEKFSNLSNI